MTQVIRAVDHDIAPGVWPDMTEHGWPADEWPAVYQQVLAADILACRADLARRQQLSDQEGHRAALRLLAHPERGRAVS